MNIILVVRPGLEPGTVRVASECHTIRPNSLRLDLKPTIPSTSSTAVLMSLRLVSGMVSGHVDKTICFSWGIALHMGVHSPTRRY